MPASRAALLLVALLASSRVMADPGRAPATATREPRRRSVLIAGVPHVQQRPDFCGEACVEMALRKLGFTVDQDQVFAVSGVDPALGRGAVTRELVPALRRLGFEVGKVWRYVRASQASSDLAEELSRLHADLVRGVPSIVCMHHDASPGTTEHFRLVLGYDARVDEIIYHEPAEPEASYRRMSRRRFLALWPLKYDPSRWLVVRIPLRVRRIAPPPRTPGVGPAALAQQVLALKPLLGRLRRFSVVVRSPFVVLGDEPRAVVERRATSLQRAARRAKTEASRVVEVWLFKDSASRAVRAGRLASRRAVLVEVSRADYEAIVLRQLRGS